MYTLYNFIAGPMVWFSLTVCMGGLAWKVIHLYLLARKKDAPVFSYMDTGYAARSIAAWSIPFFTRSMRLNPALTAVGFAFHICLFLAPLFLVAHIFMLDESIGISWVTLPDHAADTMTVIVLAACIFFAGRRFIVPEAKFVTDITDFGILALVATPFLTGFLAYHQIGDYLTMLMLHMASAEIVLMAIPFTRLGHMVLAPIIRGYMGSEFGGVRNTKDW